MYAKKEEISVEYLKLLVGKDYIDLTFGEKIKLVKMYNDEKGLKHNWALMDYIYLSFYFIFKHTEFKYH
jgi:hypothetical protein